jgi:Ca2+-binding EF-hand superfamily protein
VLWKGNGQVSFEDFVELMFTLRMQQSVKEEMREAFRIFDQDGDGYINAVDIKRTMAQLGDELSDADVAQMITEADADGDGRINFERKAVSQLFCIASILISPQSFCT